MTFVDGQTLTADQLNQAFADVAATIPDLFTTLLPAAFAVMLANLPDEANGDAIPSSGPYLSAGVLKFA